MIKKPYIIANWKLNGNKKTIQNSIITLTKTLNNNVFNYLNLIISPPIVYIDAVQNLMINNNIQLCAQNVDIHTSGAFTGETSVLMLKDLGVKFALIGHSERRMYHKENDSYITKKFSLLKTENIIPILCIGEKKINSDFTHNLDSYTKQIDSIIKLLGVKAFKNTIIAYEPEWAIGTGLNAKPEVVQSIHKNIRNYIAQYDKNIAHQVLIQYGGSVNLNNIISFISQQDIDGVLIGSASLNTENFLKIIKSLANHIKLINQPSIIK